MTNRHIREAINEAERFILKAKDLERCTQSASDIKLSGVKEYDDEDHCNQYGLDQGNLTCFPSRTRAAVKRSSIDLRNALSRMTRGE